MAVTMVIGNTPQIAASLFAPGYTLASVLANEFTEATTEMYLQALFAIGLVLFGITILVNLLAQLLLRTIAVKSGTPLVHQLCISTEHTIIPGAKSRAGWRSESLLARRLL